MSLQLVKRAFALCAATVIGLATLVGFTAGAAAAGTLTSADGYTSLTTAPGVTPNSPYSSGQHVTVTVGVNPTMNNAALVTAGFPSGAVTMKFLECADPGGTAANLPTKPSECEPGTIHSIAGAHSDGSMTTSFQVLFLPDPNLGVSNGTDCGLAPHQCVVGIFSNQNDFSKPHLFSAPFVTSQGDGSDSGANPGDGTPAPTGFQVVPPTLPSATIGANYGPITIQVTGAVPGAKIKLKATIKPPKGLKFKAGMLEGAVKTKGVAPGSYPFQVTATEKYKVGKTKASQTAVLNATIIVVS
jgi:hypothetical protein